MDSNWQDTAQFIFNNSGLQILSDIDKHNKGMFTINTKSKGLNCVTSTISEYKKQLIELHSHLSKTELA